MIAYLLGTCLLHTFAVNDEKAEYRRGQEELPGQMREHNAGAKRTGGIMIACGMARYENDERAAAVFERADETMYENKSELKAEQNA